MDLKKPNLFEFATSELSQDAFICWLMSFACEKYEQKDPALSKCASELLTKIVNKSDGLIVTNIVKQFKNIDVLLEVKDEAGNYYDVIIEDKTFTSQRNDQIKRYIEAMKESNIINNKSGQDIITVYYKIIEQSHQEKVNVTIDRNYLLELFSKYADKTENLIFLDYYEHLKKIDESVKSYSQLSIEKWIKDNRHAYKGFFVHLQNEIIPWDDRLCGWGYVNNPKGGFNALWWNVLLQEDLTHSNLKDFVEKVYLQIENDTIALKIVGYNEESPIIRASLYDYACTEVIGFERPKHLKRGKYMTVGRIKYDMDNYKEQIAIMQGLMQNIKSGKYKY